MKRHVLSPVSSNLIQSLSVISTVTWEHDKGIMPSDVAVKRMQSAMADLLVHHKAWRDTLGV